MIFTMECQSQNGFFSPQGWQGFSHVSLPVVMDGGCWSCSLVLMLVCCACVPGLAATYILSEKTWDTWYLIFNFCLPAPPQHPDHRPSNTQDITPSWDQPLWPLTPPASLTLAYSQSPAFLNLDLTSWNFLMQDKDSSVGVPTNYNISWWMEKYQDKRLFI